MLWYEFIDINFAVKLHPGLEGAQGGGLIGPQLLEWLDGTVKSSAATRAGSVARVARVGPTSSFTGLESRL